MKVLIVYDSVYGNTEQIARAIGGAITPANEVKVVRVGEANPSEFGTLDLLVIGSPTQGGRPTPPVREFLGKISELVEGIRVAAFDTRIPSRWVGIFGYAAGRIAKTLNGKCGNLVAPQGFFVKGTEGPLKDGELARAAAWAKEITR